MMRHKTNKRRDKKIFKKTANSTNTKNQLNYLPRGGKCLWYITFTY